ncbi:hypothetical protein JHK87_016364 [Glycine soja]|nr:hypothetical protein JHK87_016364 [Glycine soja]
MVQDNKGASSSEQQKIELEMLLVLVLQGGSWPIRQAIVIISANVKLAGDTTSNCKFPSMEEFSKLKEFGIICHPRKSTQIKQVTWYPPIRGWIRCNTDRVAKDSSETTMQLFWISERTMDIVMVECFSSRHRKIDSNKLKPSRILPIYYGSHKRNDICCWTRPQEGDDVGGANGSMQ